MLAVGKTWVRMNASKQEKFDTEWGVLTKSGIIVSSQASVQRFDMYCSESDAVFKEYII